MHSCFSSRRSSACNPAVQRLVMDEVTLSMNTRLGVGALDEDGELEVDKVGVSVNTRMKMVSWWRMRWVRDSVAPSGPQQLLGPAPQTAAAHVGLQGAF